MVKTNENTPGGKPTNLDNPLLLRTDPTDSGEGQTLLYKELLIEIEKLKSDLVTVTETTRSLNEKNLKLQEEIDILKTKEKEILETNQSLKMELFNLKENQENQNPPLSLPINSEINPSPSTFEYKTDDEETERETKWILQKNRKRKAKKSPVLTQDISITPYRTSKYRKDNTSRQPTEHKNISNEKCEPNEDQEQNNVLPKIKPPPPINIINVTNYSDIQNIMKELLIVDFKVVALNNGVFKINTVDSEAYRKLTAKLNEANMQWYTYENVNDRPTKVMVRGPHHTCRPEDIMEELKQKGFKILSAVNMIKKEIKKDEHGNRSILKRGLPLFMLTFEKEQKLEEIYKINSILNLKVKVEQLRKNNNLITQCKKCQAYNHTQKYCGRDPRCVKCAGKHLTNQCKIDIKVPAKCVNCQQNHPANYRGCEIAKELQKVRDKASNLRQRPMQNQVSSQKKNIESNTNDSNSIHPAITNNMYSQIVKQTKKTETAVDNTTREQSYIQDISEALFAINKRLEIQDVNYALLVEKLESMNQKIQNHNA